MGSYLTQPIKKKVINKNYNAKLAYCSAEMQGWRKTMEDAALCELYLTDDQMLFGVFDGHGGSQVSQLLKNQFANYLASNPKFKQKKIIQAIDETFQELDELIISKTGNSMLKKLRQSKRKGPQPIQTDQNTDNQHMAMRIGSTANIVLIDKQKIYVANAGDTRSVLCRNKTPIALSFDHKPTNQGEKQRIEKSGAKLQHGRINGSLNVSRCFGDLHFKQNTSLGYHRQAVTCKPQIKQYKRHPQDEFILIGCDGIWQRYDDPVGEKLISFISQRLAKKMQLQLLMQQMLQMLIAKTTQQSVGCDNMTAILIVFK